MRVSPHTKEQGDARIEPWSALPGLVHGFGRRLPDSGNEPREATQQRARTSLASNGTLYLLRQIHGALVAEAPWNGNAWNGNPNADAAVARAPGLLLGIETADCLPVLLVDPRLRQVAAAHAGWRGTAAGVAAAAVEALVARGSRPDELWAALGPAIGPCCYEVGDELREAFGPQGDAFFRPGVRGRPHLDVRAANRAQLQKSGLRPEHVQSVDECTSCRPDLYHSYRRDGKGAGRMISHVGFARG